MQSYATIVNPANPDEKYESLLWPDHCVIGTPGTEIIPEVHVDKIDQIVNKGTDPRVEMYSAFRSPLRDPPLETAVSDVGHDLRTEGISDVVVTGIAGDFCVQSTALHSAEDGWRTYVVEEAVRSVTEEGWQTVKLEMIKAGIQIVSVQWVKEVMHNVYRCKLLLIMLYRIYFSIYYPVFICTNIYAI